MDFDFGKIIDSYTTCTMYIQYLEISKVLNTSKLLLVYSYYKKILFIAELSNKVSLNSDHWTHTWLSYSSFNRLVLRFRVIIIDNNYYVVII